MHTVPNYKFYVKLAVLPPKNDESMLGGAR